MNPVKVPPTGPETAVAAAPAWIAAAYCAVSNKSAAPTKVQVRDSYSPETHLYVSLASAANSSIGITLQVISSSDCPSSKPGPMQETMNSCNPLL